MRSRNTIVLRGVRGVMTILLMVVMLGILTVVPMRNFGPNVSAEYHYGIRHRR